MKSGLIALLLTVFTFAAEITLHVEGVVDNREYFSDYEEHGTIFGLREDALLSIGKDSIHTFHAGVTWFQEFGAPIQDWPVAPLIFYRYRRNNARLLFGSFMRDSVFYSEKFTDERYDYKRPQVEGFDYQYSFPIGSENIWVDWDTQISADHGESFSVGLSGTLGFGRFSVDHHLLYRHSAGGGKPVAESGGGHLVFRFEENDIPVLDTLKATAELIGSYNRNSRDEDWNAPLGAEMSATVVFRRLGLMGRYYKGIKQSINWHQFDRGAPFYNTPQFGDISFLYYPYRNDYISMQFYWRTTFLEGDVENMQYFQITGDFGHKFSKRDE